MNAGAHGGQTKDVLVEARAIDRSGRVHVFDNAGMGFTYRHCAVPNDYVFTYAIFEGREESLRRSSARCKASPSIAKRISP